MWTKNEFSEIYQSYLSSGQSVRDYCAENGIKEGRFYHWQKKVRLEAMSCSGGFLPVSVNNRGGHMVVAGKPGAVTSQPSCEIVFPNGVTMRLNGNVSPDFIRSILTLSR